VSVTEVGTPTKFQTTGTGTPKAIGPAAWGTGQDRAAGDLLVALVTASGSTSAGAITEQTSYGWTKIYEGGGTYVKAAIFTKTAAADATAPTFQSTIAGTSARCHVSVTIWQLHSTVATPVVDTGAQVTGTSASPFIVTTAANVAGAGEFGLAVVSMQYTTSAANTWGAVTGFTQVATDAATAYYHYVDADNSSPASGAPLSYNPTHSASTGLGGAIAVFKDGTLQPDTPPQLIQYAETVWNTTGAKSTPSVSWLAGDLIYVIGGVESSGTPITTPTATGLSFAADGTTVGSGSQCLAQSWVATAAADGSSAVSSTGAGALNYGLAVWVFRDHGGKGVRAGAVGQTVSLARSSPHSRVILGSFDYSTDAPSGLSWTPAIDAGGTEREKSTWSIWYDTLVADWGDQGNAGTTSYGTTGTATGPFSTIAVEIKGIYTAAEVSSATGGARLKKMSAAGSGSGITSASTPAGSAGQVSYDSVGPSSAGAGVSSNRNLSWTHPAGADHRAIVVGVEVDAITDTGWVVSATCAGNTMTPLGVVHANNGSAGILAVFGIADQGSGTLAIAVSTAGAGVPDDTAGGSIAFSAADLSSPFGSPQTAAGSSTAPSKALTAAATSMIAGFVASGDGVSSADAPATSRFIDNYMLGSGYAVGNVAGSTASGTGSPVTMSWYVATGPWAVIVVEVKGALTGAPGIPMKKMGIAGTGEIVTVDESVVTGGPRLKKMSASGAASGFADSSGGPRLKKARVSVTASGITVVSAGPRLKKMGVSGTATKVHTLSGGPGLKKMTIAGTSAGITVVSAGPRLKKESIAGSGSGISVVSAGPRMKKMSAAGTGSGITVVSTGPRLKKMGISGSGTKVHDLSGGISLKKMGVSGSGSVFAEEVAVVSGGPGLKKMSAAGAGSGITVVSAGPRLKKITVSSSGTGITVVSAGPRLKKMSVSSSGSGITVVSAGPRLKKMGVSGTGTKVHPLSGGISLEKMKITGTGTGITVVSAGPALKKMGVSGSGSPVSSASGGARMKKMSVFGFEGELAVFSGGPRLDKMTVSGTGAGITVTSAGPRLKKMKVAGTGSGITVISGGPSLERMRISGTGTGISVLSGGTTLARMELSGTGEGFADVTGGASMKKMRVLGSSTKIVESSDMFIFSML
jgi:hypothetical protein